MKTVVVFLVLCSVGALAGMSNSKKMELIKYKAKCMTATGVTDDMILDTLSGKVEETNNNQLKCFAACLLKMIGIMNADGTLNIEIVRKERPPDIPEEDIEDLINKCKDLTGENDCEKAANLVHCFLENKTFKVFS